MNTPKISHTVILADAYYTEAEAAEIRRKSPRTLARERQSGLGCKFLRNGKSALYKGSDLIAFLESRSYSSTSNEDLRRRA